MTRGLVAVAMLLGGLLAGQEAVGQAVPGAVNCASRRLDGAERAICASPDLKRLSDSVDRLTRQLEARLTGDDRAALLATERPFVTERNNDATKTERVLAGGRAAHRRRAGAVGSGAVARMPTLGRGVP